MYSFSVIETFTDAPVHLVSGICDLEAVTTAGVTRLYSATRAGGGVLAFEVGASMVKIDEQLTTTSAPLPAAAHLEQLTLNGTNVMLVTGANGLRISGYRMEADGSLGPGVSYRGTPAGVLSAAEVVVQGADTFLYISRADEASVHIHKYNTTTAQFQLVNETIFGPDLQGVDVTQLMAVQSQGTTYLVASSLSGDCIRSFAIAADGTLTPAGVMGSPQGLGLTDPKGLQSVTMDGVTYLLGTASGSSSISVIAVEPDGSLRAADHVMDSLDTRIQGVQALFGGDSRGPGLRDRRWR